MRPGVILLALLLGAPSATARAQGDAAARDVRFPGGYALEPLPASERVGVGGGVPLTLEQVLSAVRGHHPTIEAAQAAVRAARGERLAAEGGFDLSLSAQAWAAPTGYYEWGRASVGLTQPTPLWGATFFGGWRVGAAFGDPDAPGLPSYYRGYETLPGGELRAGVRVPLWRDGPIDARRRRLWAAEHAIDAEVASLDDRALQLRYEARVAYWRWAAEGAKYRVAAELLDLAEARDGQIRARVAAGARPAIDALENRRVVLARRRGLVAARRALEQAAIELSIYLRGADGEPRVPPPSRVPEMAVPTRLAADLRTALRVSIERHPAMARYAALRRRQEVSVEYWENQLAPRIDVQVAGSIDLGDGSERQQRTLESPVVEASVLFELPLQLREARGGIDRERADLESLRAEAQLARNRIEAGVRDALSAVQAAEEGVALAEEASAIADAVAAAERRRLELGAAELFIVNLRESHAAEAQSYLAEARAGLQVAHARWDAVTAANVSSPPVAR